jgi:putative endonuclease
MDQTKQFGRWAEDTSCEYLIDKGYRLITRNFKTKIGEIDLIFQDHDQLVFVEVKARHHDRYGEPFEAVNPRKLHKIGKVGLQFMQFYPKLPQSARIEVISITSHPSGKHHLEHIEAF